MMVLWNFFAFMCASIDPNCDHYQEMALGQEYYVYNLEYPLNYTAGTSCRWSGRSPVGTKIVISCQDVELPASRNCNEDRLSVSLTGNANFADADNYCGIGSFTLVTKSNDITVGLCSTKTSIGGRFLCTLTAIESPSSAVVSLPTTCDCGWKQQTRITGGQETGVNEYPSMVALVHLQTTQAYCGGAIISDRYVITAAHCILFNQELENMGILVGDHDLTSGTDTAYSALYRPEYYLVHPDYVEDGQINDLGILKTSSRIVFSEFVGPICLPFRYTSKDFNDDTVTALGWGQLEFSGVQSDTLQEVNLTVIANSDCAPQQENRITAGQLCTYSPGKDACQSDSGGPLLWMDANTNRMQLVGTISYGLGCGSSRPGVNTRLTYYLDWIVSKTTDAAYCIK